MWKKNSCCHPCVCAFVVQSNNAYKTASDETSRLIQQLKVRNIGMRGVLCSVFALLRPSAFLEQTVNMHVHYVCSYQDKDSREGQFHWATEGQCQRTMYCIDVYIWLFCVHWCSLVYLYVCAVPRFKESLLHDSADIESEARCWSDLGFTKRPRICTDN